MANKTKKEISEGERTFRQSFFVNLLMLISPVNIIILIYWGVKKKKDLFYKGLAMFLTILIFLAAFVGAMCTMYKTDPISLVKYGEFSLVAEDGSKLNTNGYLNVGGRLLQITSEEDDMILSYDSEKVVLYSPDKSTHLVMYEDSGIEVGSLSDEELAETLLIEDPADYFDEYSEKYYNVAERTGIADKDCYVTYTQGLSKVINDDGETINGSYTEMYVFQDVGAETYLSIRIADYTGEAPSILLGKYALSMVKTVG